MVFVRTGKNIGVLQAGGEPMLFVFVPPPLRVSHPRDIFVFVARVGYAEAQGGPSLSCFVSGHDFSRAENSLKKTGGF
jgi:hypothetical protein